MFQASAQNKVKHVDVKPVITNADIRKGISLDGTWNYILDPYKTGYRKSKRYNFSQKTRNEDSFVEYKFQEGSTLQVPGDWNTQEDALFYYEGLVWYQRNFVVSKDLDKNYQLYFGAVNYKAKIYLNGEYVGSHEGGFTPFNFSINNFLLDGDNHIVVAVDNERKEEYVPTLKTDWWNYGGITRSVKLLELPKTYIANYKIQLSKNKANHISGYIKLNDSVTSNVTVDIPELNISKIFITDETGYAKIEFKAKPELWFPDTPKLYDVRLSVGNHKISEPIGFRTIETKGTEILLNGKPIFLKGVSLHDEAAYRGGRIKNRNQANQLLTWVKELNGNYVRLAHYPHHEDMLREADRLGLLVWSEIPVYWDILWENKHSYEIAEAMLKEMVLRDQNRASIIIWSVANETPQGDSRTVFLRNLINKTKELDDTRLISAALHEVRFEKNINTKYIEDDLANYVDLLSINSYCGWYGGSNCEKLKWVSKFGKPMIMSEYGGGSLQGYLGPKTDRWTEEFQANIYREHVEMFKNIDFLAGVSPWILKDFRSPLRMHPKYQDYWNRKGLISDEGIKKQAYYVLQSYFISK